MATSTLQDILAREPGLATRIDTMTELIAGVPASKENLKTLLKHLMKKGETTLEGTDQTGILLIVAKQRKKKEIIVRVLGKAEVMRGAHASGSTSRRQLTRTTSSASTPEDTRRGPGGGGPGAGDFNSRPCVCSEVFPCTEDGLLQGLLYAKQNRKRYREEGPCPDCVRSDESLRPVKKLKAQGMPKCEACMFKAIVA